MAFKSIPIKQAPIVLAVLVAMAVVGALVSRVRYPRSIEQAVRSGSPERVAEAVARHPEHLNRPGATQGMTPLHWAAMQNRTAAAECLLAAGADVNAGDEYGMTPLHKAAAFGLAPMAELLLSYGADLEALGTKYGVIRMTPLHLAAEGGFADVIEVLLGRGADINRPTAGQNAAAPLHLAAARGREAVVTQLLRAGADVNARDSHKKTALAWAIQADQFECANTIRLFGGTE